MPDLAPSPPASLHVSSLVVHCRTDRSQGVARHLRMLPGAEIHGGVEVGKLVVTLETATEGEILARVGGVSATKELLRCSKEQRDRARMKLAIVRRFIEWTERPGVNTDRDYADFQKITMEEFGRSVGRRTVYEWRGCLPATDMRARNVDTTDANSSGHSTCGIWPIPRNT